MNRPIPVFTPIAKPMEYDALSGRIGCEEDTGNDWFGSLAFSQVCLYDHELAAPNHDQIDTVSYSVGPATTGVATPKPFTTIWAAWVGGAGVRIDDNRRSITPPANATGVADTLYEFVRPTKLTHYFDNSALLHIAIQKTDTTIELKRYTDITGTIATLSFTGFSPVMFNAGTIASGSPSVPNLALYYLKVSDPFVLFARFAAEAFATERIVMPSLRIALARLIGCTSEDSVHYLHAVDENGMDVTLSTKQYAATATEEAVVSAEFSSGIIFEITAPTTALSDEECVVSAAFVSGFTYDATAESASIASEEATVTMSFENGEMERIT